MSNWIFFKEQNNNKKKNPGKTSKHQIPKCQTKKYSQIFKISIPGILSIENVLFAKCTKSYADTLHNTALQTVKCKSKSANICKENSKIEYQTILEWPACLSLKERKRKISLSVEFTSTLSIQLHMQNVNALQLISLE